VEEGCLDGVKSCIKGLMSAVKKMCCTTSIPIFFAGEFFGEISGS
jgi:hypothetical protein